MPGKVNPVIIEAIIQLGLKAKNDAALVNDCASMGSLQINEYLPLLGETILGMIDRLTDATTAFATHTANIQANPEICAKRLFSGTSIITAFLPIIGYEKAEILVDRFRQSGRSDFKNFLEDELGSETVNEQLEPAKLMALGHRVKKRLT